MTQQFKPAALIPVDLRDPQTGVLPTSIVGTGRVTPPQIASAYGMPADNGAGRKVGIISFGGGFLQSDLNSSFADLVAAGLLPTGTVAPTINKVLLDGQTGIFSAIDNASGENTVDIYCVATLIPAANITIYIGGSFETTIARAVSDGCDIITISWATLEYSGLESVLNSATSNKVAVCVASGDWGSSFPGSTVTNVCYPSSSPQVISIGGTKLTLNTNNTRATETDDNRDPSFGSTWGGGGGVSRLFSLPSWQSGLYYTPITNNVMGSPTPLTMRGAPDISAPMNVYGLYFNGAVSGFGGTSLASPTMAGFLARMQNLTQRKLSSIEYNQIFYANKDSFYDITVGTNNTQITSGYAGTTSWDAVTGLGPPIGQMMLNDITVPPVLTAVAPNVVVNPFSYTSPLTLFTVSQGQGPFTWSIGPTLPAGLSFDSLTGQLFGTSTVITSPTVYEVVVTDLYGRQATSSVTIESRSVPLSSTVDYATVTVHPFVSAAAVTPVRAVGGNGNITYSISPSLPAPFTFNTVTGSISAGASTNLFNTTFTVTMQDQTGATASGSFVFQSTSVPITVTRTFNKLYAYPLTSFNVTPLQITGGNGTVHYSITPTTLPTGLTFNSSNGTISGTAQLTSRSSYYTIAATDQLGYSQSLQAILKVKSPLDVIDSDQQNLVYDSLFSIMGTTATGYGATMISEPIVPGKVVNADDWNKFIVDIERCLIHQNGTSTNNLLQSHTGSGITLAAPARIYTAVQFLQENVGHADPSQLTSFTYNSTATSPVSWTCTNYSSTATMLAGQGYVSSVNWSWFYDNQLKYFFNLGGRLIPKISIVKARSQERAAWAALAAAANSEAEFGISQFRLALENPEKTYTYTFSGPGDKLARLRNRRNQSKYGTTIYYITEQDTDIYAGTALTITYRVSGSSIIGTYNFVAGLGKKKKSKKIFGKKVFKKTIGRYIRVSVQLETDFKTIYPHGSRGGIAAQIPQMQIVANSLSATPAPIPEFVMGVDEASTVQTITLRNNSTLTCAVSDIVLSGYTTGTAFPSTFDIAPHSSTDISLYYVGHAPGHYIGLVDVLCNINRLTLFTEVNVGSTNPKSVELTTSTYDIISQDFQVDHAGGYFKDFAVNFGVYNPSNGFTNTSHVGKTNDVFNITFDPDNLANGTYVSTATVTVNPMDSSVEPSVFKTHMTVHLNVDNRHVADWTSAILGTNTVLHLSYDIIGGRKYFTAGIGSNTAPISELRGRHTEFPSWQEVYRIPLGDVLAKFYSKDYLVKSQPNFTYGNYFGVGTGKGSILNVEYDGKGNLEVLMNALFEIPAANATEAQDLSTALRYYDSRRAHQLQNSSGLTQGGQTYMFVGFDRSGDTLTSLVSPN